MVVCLLLSRDTVRQRESLQVRNYDTGAAPCLYPSKSTGNVWLPLTMGGDCSRWYLRKREEEKNREKEGEREKVLSVSFLSLSLMYECLVHMTAKSTSELVSTEACWAGWAWTSHRLITLPY